MNINRDQFIKLYEAIKPRLLSDSRYWGMSRMEDRMEYIRTIIYSEYPGSI